MIRSGITSLWKIWPVVTLGKRKLWVPGWQLAAAMSGDGAMVQGPAQHTAETLRVDAIVTIGDREWLRRRWVTRGSGGYSQLPWRFVRTEAARPLVVGAEFSGD